MLTTLFSRRPGLWERKRPGPRVVRVPWLISGVNLLAAARLAGVLVAGVAAVGAAALIAWACRSLCVL